MKFVIFGAGGMATEVIGYIESDGHEVAYVVSDEVFSNAHFNKRYAVVPAPLDDRLPGLLCVAEPAVKRTIVERFPQVLWGSFWHSSCYVSPHAIAGRGCIGAPQAILAGDPVLKQFCFLNTNATIGHGSRLGEYATLFPNSEICGDCDVGADCILGIGAYVLPGLTVHAGSKISAGAVVHESTMGPSNLYGDRRGNYRVSMHNRNTK